MTREHSPRPGRTWDTRLTAAELLIDDTTLEGHNDPQSPKPNRATRRAQQRAGRQKGNQ